MLFTAVLVVATALAALVGRRASWRDRARWGLAVAMAVAGASHLLSPAPFLAHLPPWTPLPELIVVVSGVVEIAFGAALLAPARWRPLVGRALAVFFVAVLPANVYVAVAGVDVPGQPGGLYPWLRIPFQALFIAWVLWSTAQPATPVAEAQEEPEAVACASAS
ncbi:MAG TPA: hypothetical protein VIK95_11020 [Egibacteraceae bacterium]